MTKSSMFEIVELAINTLCSCTVEQSVVGVRVSRSNGIRISSERHMAWQAVCSK